MRLAFQKKVIRESLTVAFHRSTTSVVHANLALCVAVFLVLIFLRFKLEGLPAHTSTGAFWARQMIAKVTRHVRGARGARAGCVVCEPASAMVERKRYDHR